MGKDPEGTLAALKAIRSELADPKIEEHPGRKTIGGGLLLEFASVVDAVRCAVEVPREMLRRNTEIPRRAGSAVVANYKAGTGSGSATCL